MQTFRSTLILLTACAFYAWGAPSASAEPPVHELKLKDDDRLSGGKVAAVQGRVAAEGIRLIVRKLSVDQPILAILAAKEGEGDLVFRVYKHTWDKPILEGNTSEGGLKTFRFRSGGNVAFEITGKENSSYQLIVMVGPEIKPIQPSAFVPMSTYKAAATATTAAETPAAATPAPDDDDTFLYVLIIVVIVLLAAIVFMMYRGQQRKNIPVILLFAFGMSFLTPAAFAVAEVSAPREIGDEEFWQQGSEFVHKFREGMGRLPKTGNKQVDDMLGHIKIAISLLEQYGYIDPQEAAVQPNYSPDGMPALPSRCYEDLTGKCAQCFAQANEGLTKSRRLLEVLWVIYKQTMLETGRIIELADAATGISPLASFAWKVQKLNPNDPVNKSKAKFFASYDENYGKLIKRLNDSLISIGKCERDNFDDQDWYPRYGLPYYLFMTDRYKRK